MPTLVIHAPQNQKQSFSQTVATGRGDGYAISRGLFQQLSPDDDVVVICKVHQKQAVGKIKELILTVKAGNGIQRYDVIMLNVEPAAYSFGGVRLNRNGVTVI